MVYESHRRLQAQVGYSSGEKRMLQIFDALQRRSLAEKEVSENLFEETRVVIRFVGLSICQGYFAE
jgi:hypothetical protein